MASRGQDRCTVALRIRELGAFWHLWRAQLMEDLGDVPAGLESSVCGCIGALLQDTRAKLEDARLACEETISSLTESAKCAPSPRSSIRKEEHGLD